MDSVTLSSIQDQGKPEPGVDGLDFPYMPQRIVDKKTNTFQRLYRGWNEIKVSGKLPERRGYHIACLHGSDMLVFGGQDLKKGCIDTCWSLPLGDIIEQAREGDAKMVQRWQPVNCQGKVVKPISHFTAFQHNGVLFCFGGQLGLQGMATNKEILQLSLSSNRWTTYSVPEDVPCKEDHAAAFDSKAEKCYIFGGYIDGDKSNDIWSFDLGSRKWECLHPGDYKEPEFKQQPKKIPAPRIGAKMIQIAPDTLLVQNGHDNENEKIGDLWKFDLNARTWTAIEQKGDVPAGRTGHTLINYRGYLIMYGGILEVTKETEDIYALHLESMTWTKVITTAGPTNLDSLFAGKGEKEQVKVSK